MKMFNKEQQKERIGDIEKSTTLSHLQPVEKYFVKKVKESGLAYDYDVIANELPYFKTLSYTEVAHSFYIYPLQQELRCKQFEDGFTDDTPVQDWSAYFRDRVENAVSNKYSHIEPHNIKAKSNLIIPVGSNKLKETVCLNKLLYIIEHYGKNNVYLKPHPLTSYELVGELKDILGNSIVLDRDLDMYSLLLHADTIHTSHRSESTIYAAALGKTLDPIDVYNKAESGSYYPINKHLFNNKDPKTWLNKTFSSPKSGIINPEVDKDWKEKMDKYFEYLLGERALHKNQFVYDRGGSK